MSKINTIKYNCASNGPGVRTAIYISGCSLKCPGCFNHEAWDYNFGDEITDELIDTILKSIEPYYIEGLSILGGEPMDPRNQEAVYKIVKAFREKFKTTDDKTIWLWTGYSLNKNLPETDYTEAIKSMVDVIVDGPWMKGLYDPSLKFRGSSNQRILYNGVDF